MPDPKGLPEGISRRVYVPAELMEPHSSSYKGPRMDRFYFACDHEADSPPPYLPELWGQRVKGIAFQKDMPRTGPWIGRKIMAATRWNAYETMLFDTELSLLDMALYYQRVRPFRTGMEKWDVQEHKQHKQHEIACKQQLLKLERLGLLHVPFHRQFGMGKRKVYKPVMSRVCVLKEAVEWSVGPPPFVTEGWQSSMAAKADSAVCKGVSKKII